MKITPRRFPHEQRASLAFLPFAWLVRIDRRARLGDRLSLVLHLREPSPVLIPHAHGAFTFRSALGRVIASIR
jgi:hypothetical protein